MKRYIHDKSAVDMLHEFETKLEEMKAPKFKAPKFNTEQEEIESAYDPYRDPAHIWEIVRSKQVYDLDGFLTDYTLWYNNETGDWCTIFGDNDLYQPWDSDHDMDFESEDEAQDWFDDYRTEDEDDDYF